MRDLHEVYLRVEMAAFRIGHVSRLLYNVQLHINVKQNLI